MNLKFLSSAIFAVFFGMICCAIDIAEIDSNFRTANIGNAEVHFYNALAGDPFELTGFPWWDGEGPLYRLPPNLTSDDVTHYISQVLGYHTSGGAIRFRSNSPAIYLRAELYNGTDMPHMTRGGSGGFDLFVNAGQEDEYIDGSVFPSPEAIKGAPIEARVSLWRDNEDVRDYTLYLPLYSGVKSLEIGIEPGAILEAPLPQTIDKPIVFYGSSVTQGACASRPGNNFATMLCRAVDAPQVNIGLSGSATGQLALARAIAELDPAVFVYDYDYNAPDPNFLARTHEPFFLEFRKYAPDVPVIMLSKCTMTSPERTAIIKKTYDNAVARGDQNVCFIDGKELFGDVGQIYARVDPYHPNDLGFYMMYQRILPVLREVLEINYQQ